MQAAWEMVLLRVCATTLQCFLFIGLGVDEAKRRMQQEAQAAAQEREVSAHQ